MDQPRMTDDQMLAAMRAGDMSATTELLIGDRLRNPQRAANSELSIRTDKDGKPRWFHQTKGWRGLVLTSF
jgi:hypothetical protein